MKNRHWLVAFHGTKATAATLSFHLNLNSNAETMHLWNWMQTLRIHNPHYDEATSAQKFDYARCKPLASESEYSKCLTRACYTTHTYYFTDTLTRMCSEAVMDVKLLRWDWAPIGVWVHVWDLRLTHRLDLITFTVRLRRMEATVTCEWKHFSVNGFTGAAYESWEAVGMHVLLRRQTADGKRMQMNIIRSNYGIVCK